MKVILEKKWLVAAVTILVFALLALGSWYRSSRDLRRIEKNMASLLKLASKEQAESVVASVAKTRRAAAYLDEQVSVDFGGLLPGIEGRNACISFLQQTRTMATSLAIKTHDKKTVLAVDRQEATMNLTMEVTVKYAGETAREFREVRIEWVKKNRDWLIRKAAVVQTIRPPLFSTVD